MYLQIGKLVLKTNVIFEIYFYLKMLSKFQTSYFSKTYLRDNLRPRLLAVSNLRTAVKLFAAVLEIKEAKIIVVEDSGHKCTCNNSTRESENLKNFFCKSYILNLNWG